MGLLRAELHESRLQMAKEMAEQRRQMAEQVATLNEAIATLTRLAVAKDHPSSASGQDQPSASAQPGTRSLQA